MTEKMSLKEFTEFLIKNMKAYLPMEYASAEIEVSEVVKNNDLVLHGMAITRQDQNITPTIYLDKFFEEYLSGKTLESILKMISKIRVEADIPERFDTEMVLNFKQCEDRIYPRLINYELNRKMLENKPYRAWKADLAVIFYLHVGDLTDGEASITINKKMLEVWNISEEELYKAAMRNEARHRYTLKTLGSILRSLGGKMDLEESVPMLVLSNEKRVNGATALLDSERLKEMERKLGSFYILPSSIHELLILPAATVDDLTFLHSMVRAVNDSEVDEDERLSYHVYQYTRQSGFEIAK